MKEKVTISCQFKLNSLFTAANSSKTQKGKDYSEEAYWFKSSSNKKHN